MEEEKKLSARWLGKLIGLSAAEMNKKLNEAGLLSGSPGNWFITELGKKFAEVRGWDNGYGGRAARGYTYYVWSKDVLNKIRK